MLNVEAGSILLMEVQHGNSVCLKNAFLHKSKFISDIF